MAGRGRKVRKAKIAYDRNKKLQQEELKIQNAYISFYHQFNSGSPSIASRGTNNIMQPYQNYGPAGRGKGRGAVGAPLDSFSWVTPDAYRTRITTASGTTNVNRYTKSAASYKAIADWLRPKAINAELNKIPEISQSIATRKPFDSSGIRGNGGNRMGAVYAGNKSSGIGVSSASGWLGGSANTSGGSAGLATIQDYVNQGGWANKAYEGDTVLQEKLAFATTEKQRRDLRAESEKRKQNEYLSLFGSGLVGVSAMGSFDADSGKAKDSDGKYIRKGDIPKPVSVFDMKSNLELAASGEDISYQGWNDLSGSEQVEFKGKLQDKLNKMDIIDKIADNKIVAAGIQSEIKTIENKIKTAETALAKKNGVVNSSNTGFYNISALEDIKRDSKSVRASDGLSYEAYFKQESSEAKTYSGKWAGTGVTNSGDSKYIRSTLSAEEKKIQAMYIEMNKLQEQKEQISNTNTVFINAAAEAGTDAVVLSQYNRGKMSGQIRNIMVSGTGMNDSRMIDQNIMDVYAIEEDKSNAKLKVYAKVHTKLKDLDRRKKNTVTWKNERDSLMAHVNSVVPDLLVHGETVTSTSGNVGTTGTQNTSTLTAMRGSAKYGEMVSTKGVIAQMNAIISNQKDIGSAYSDARSAVANKSSVGMTNEERMNVYYTTNSKIKSIRNLEEITGRKIKTGINTYSIEPVDLMNEIVGDRYVMLKPKINKFGEEVPVYKLDKDGKKIKLGLKPKEKKAWTPGDPTPTRGSATKDWMHQWVTDGGSKMSVKNTDLMMSGEISGEVQSNINAKKQLLDRYGAWNSANNYIAGSLNQWTDEATNYYGDTYKDESMSERQIIQSLWRGDTSITGDNVVDDLRDEMFSKRAMRTEGAGRSSDIGKLYRGAITKRDEWKNAMDVSKSQLIEAKAEEARLQKSHDAYGPQIQEKIREAIGSEGIKQGQRLAVDKKFGKELKQSSESLFDAHNKVKELKLKQQYYKLSIEKSDKSIAEIKQEKKEADFDTYQSRTNTASTNRLQRGPLYGYYQAQGLKRRTGGNRQKKVTRSGKASLGGLVL